MWLLHIRSGIRSALHWCPISPTVPSEITSELIAPQSSDLFLIRDNSFTISSFRSSYLNPPHFSSVTLLSSAHHTVIDSHTHLASAHFVFGLLDPPTSMTNYQWKASSATISRLALFLIPYAHFSPIDLAPLFSKESTPLGTTPTSRYLQHHTSLKLTLFRFPNDSFLETTPPWKIMKQQS